MPRAASCSLMSASIKTWRACSLELSTALSFRTAISVEMYPPRAILPPSACCRILESARFLATVSAAEALPECSRNYSQCYEILKAGGSVAKPPQRGIMTNLMTRGIYGTKTPVNLEDLCGLLLSHP